MADATHVRTRAVLLGWAVMVLLGIILVVNGLALYAFVEGTAQGRTVGLLHTGFGAMALAAALAGLRSAGRWAWWSGWVVAASLAALALHMGSAGSPDIAIWYFGLTVVALIGQLLARGR